MSLSRSSAISPTAPTSAATAPTSAATAPTSAATAPLKGRTHSGLYRCRGCGGMTTLGGAQCYDTSECGDRESVYDDELQTEDDLGREDSSDEEPQPKQEFADLCTPGLVPPGFRFSVSRGKAIPKSMRSSSHSAGRSYFDKNGHEVLCPDTPPPSPKRQRTSGGVVVPETPTRQDNSRLAELEKMVEQLQGRVSELEAKGATQKVTIDSLCSCIKQMREASA